MEQVDGILIIDKPAGMTSHDVVASIRRILQTKRVGHTGTLDPFATGVLVVMIGKATRLAQFLDKDDKEYIAGIKFGYGTDTGDVTGTQTTGSELDSDELATLLLQTDWNAVFTKFQGEIMQVPPMYSAKKIGGRKLYELAREGKTVEREPVPVRISEIALTDESRLITDGILEIKIVCSAGTYIRTLAEDIGRSMGVGAHLVSLRRTGAGNFKLSESITLDALEKLDEPQAPLLPIERAVMDLAESQVANDRIEKTRNGLSSRVQADGFTDGQVVRLVDGANNLIAVGIYNHAEKSISPKVVLI
jgi:tRNA pseudouridine55 synthase